VHGTLAAIALAEQQLVVHLTVHEGTITVRKKQYRKNGFSKKTVQEERFQ
jgi:hypothetical protein